MARILIVDDSPTEMYKLTAMLEKHGHQVLKAEHGADGVAQARQEKPVAVLMEIVMPGVNGFDMAAAIEKCRSELPVIMVSGRKRAAEFSVRAGNIRLFLSKPYNKDMIGRAIRDVLDKEA